MTEAVLMTRRMEAPWFPEVARILRTPKEALTVWSVDPTR
jgi:hypothetical protein